MKEHSPAPAAPAPLVSIFCFVKNRRETIRRCVDSLLAQTWPRVEIVVQDGASTDGTLEILREYGDRIALASEPDSGPDEAFWRALKRCRGDLIGSCQSDEALFPYAADWAVTHLARLPEAGGVYGDTLITDGAGAARFVKPGSEEFSVRKYLLREAHLEFVSLFLRRAALEDAGLRGRAWRAGCAEYELVARLALRHPLRHVPGLIGQYADHDGASSQQPATAARLAAAMREFLLAFLNEKDTPSRLYSILPLALPVWDLRAASILIRAGKFDDALPLLRRAAEAECDPREFLRLKHRWEKRSGRKAGLRPWKFLPGLLFEGGRGGARALGDLAEKIWWLAK